MEMISAGAQFMFQALQSDAALAENLSRLRTRLPQSWELIERSECWRFKYKNIDDLIPQLKDAAYEARTIISEFEYEELKQIHGINRGFRGELIYSSLITNLRNWMSGSTTKVKEIRERLDNVYINLRETCDRHGIPENPNQFSTTARPVTSSFVTEPKVFGRDKELDEVIHLLGVILESSNRSHKRKREKKEKGADLPESSVAKKDDAYVLPIVGIGGVGKTTLAQMVCNNKHVKSHFELIIWVCVSDNFDVVRLTKEIIGCVTTKACYTDNLNYLQVTLKEMLGSKRFLLVLDDIWSESRTDWDRLFTPLKEGCEGSMIIVTTRSLKVAEITGTFKLGPIILEGLEPNVYWDFFTSCAFGPETNLENYPELREIGKQIVVKLKGSPLAAKTLGGLLRTDLNERHWKNIKDSEIWELQQEEHGILPVLQLSYQYLPSLLKKLFSFCSLFPKDYNFYESELIKFWIGEGFIDPQQKQQMKVVAKGHIDNLISRCFFQQVPNKPNNYVIHDLMHDVAQSITKDECFRIENDNFEKICKDIRHLSVFSKNLKLEKLKELCQYKKLHSLIIQRVSNHGSKAIESWFSKITNIHSLSLSKCKMKMMPESIGNLIHLRSLDISDTKIKQLPNSFCNLYKLEFLDMTRCDEFECFPEGANRLISMKMLILPMKKYPLVGHIPNLTNAIQLEDLDFPVWSREDIGVLKQVTRIYGKMNIGFLENVSSKEEAEQMQLNNKEFVDSLYLSWHYMRESIKNHTHEEVLEGLCPHSNLKELVIDGYRGEILPSWLTTEKLPNLTTIKFIKFDHITDIPCLPRSIILLEIKNCLRLTSLQNCLVPINLPSIVKICIEQCDELVSMPGDIFQDFVSLQALIVRKCEKLKWEMVLPPYLQDLELRMMSQLEEWFYISLQNLTSLSRLILTGCHLKLRSSNEMILPPSLKALELYSCYWEDLISVNFQNLTSLTSLTIGSFKLKCPTEMVLPSSLQKLELLYDCGELEERLNSLQNLTSLTHLKIREFDRMTSIPDHVTSNLKSLERLRVWCCNELQSIGGRAFLESVYIYSCPKLEETSGKNFIKGTDGLW